MNIYIAVRSGVLIIINIYKPYILSVENLYNVSEKLILKLIMFYYIISRIVYLKILLGKAALTVFIKKGQYAE